MERLEKLGPKHEAMIRMRLAGRSNPEICKELGIARHTLVVWLCDDLVKAKIEQMAADIERTFVTEMATNGMRAFDALVTMATTPVARSKVGASHQLEAIREVLDRVNGLQRKGQAAHEHSAAPVANQQALVFANMSDQQLLDMLAQVPAPVIEAGETGESE